MTNQTPPPPSTEAIERSTVNMVVTLGKLLGYGRLIRALRDQWKKDLMEKFPDMSEDMAERATNV